MRIITHYECDVCKAVYESEEVAKLCDAKPVPPCPVKVGDEIKLKNRDRKTFTLAVVKELKVSSFMADLGFSASLRGMQTDWNPHDWLAVLEQPVYLDHKWEESTDEIFLRIYLVTDEEAAANNMERADNKGSA